MKRITSLLVTTVLLATTCVSSWAAPDHRPGRPGNVHRPPVNRPPAHRPGHSGNVHRPPVHRPGYPGNIHRPPVHRPIHRPIHRPGHHSRAAIVSDVTALAVGTMIGAAVASRQPVTPQYGTTVYSLPGGCSTTYINGVAYQNCGGVYHQPFMGSRGVYYEIVEQPR